VKWLWIIPLCLLGLIVLILLLPAKARVRYDGSLTVWGGLGPISVKVYPAQKKKEGHAKKKEEKLPQQIAEKPKRKITLEEVRSYLHLAVDALGRIKRMLVIRNLAVHAVIANADPSKAAMAYGGAAAVISSMMPVLEEQLRIRKTDLAVDLDFTGEASVMADVTVSAVVLCLLIAAMQIFRRFRQIQQPKQTEKKV